MAVSYLRNKQRKENYVKPTPLVLSAIIIYFVLSFYESFINVALFPITKYYIIMLVALLLFSFKFMQIKYYHICVGAWLMFKCASVLWTWNGLNVIVSSNLLSQFSMVALFIVITLVDYDSAAVRKFLIALEVTSFSQGLLSLFFSDKFVSFTRGKIMSSRIVLTLFGAQNDPNNTAAFLIVGICIAMYYALIERKKIFLNLAVLIINAFSLFQTGSRGGLISLIGLVLILIVLPSKPHEKPAEKIFKSVLLAVVAIVGMSIIINLSDDLALSRLLDSDNYDTGGGRIEIWLNALEIIRLSPLFGLGWGCYYGYNGYIFPVHNVFLQNMCDTGLVGSVLLFMPLVEIFRLAIKKRSSLAVAILAAGLLPSLFLDSLNKRFFWNAIIMALILVRSNFTCEVAAKKKRKSAISDCKYVRSSMQNTEASFDSSYIRKV